MKDDHDWLGSAARQLGGGAGQGEEDQPDRARGGGNHPALLPVHHPLHRHRAYSGQW